MHQELVLTSPPRRELHITPSHPVELLPLCTFRSFLDHAIAVCQLTAENIAEDLCISVRMQWESIPSSNAVFVQYSQATEVEEAVVEVVGEAEGVVCFQPAAVLSISALTGATECDLDVAERF